MSIPHAPEPVMLITGLLRAPDVDLEQILPRLEALAGPVLARTPEIPFSFTEYYRDEMGPVLFRSYLTFQRLIVPDQLAPVKLSTNAIESDFSRNGQRRINLDPGLLSSHNLILASCKDFSHRIYLGRGVCAEVTMLFVKGRFRILPWTYPDYAAPETQAFFSSQRTVLLTMRRARRAAGA